MHFTEPVYRNPYWPTWPLLEITRGCTHNKCKFCTMYKGVRFGVPDMETIEADLRELAATDPHARTIQLLSANPLALPYDRLAPILEKINEYLPEIEYIYGAGRVTDFRNKTVEQLRALRDLGMREISMGTESGDDWTLERINKGYHAADILEQCAKLDEAGVRYWHTFLNGVAGTSHSREHAINSAKCSARRTPWSWARVGSRCSRARRCSKRRAPASSTHLTSAACSKKCCCSWRTLSATARS